MPLKTLSEVTKRRIRRWIRREEELSVMDLLTQLQLFGITWFVFFVLWGFLTDTRAIMREAAQDIKRQANATETIEQKLSIGLDPEAWQKLKPLLMKEN